jgi:outer membrane protein assembly factor BamB
MDTDRSLMKRRRALQTLGIALTTGCLRASSEGSTETPGEPSPPTETPAGTVGRTRTPSDGTTPEETPTPEPSEPDDDSALDPTDLTTVWTDEVQLYGPSFVAEGTVLARLEGENTFAAWSLSDGTELWQTSFDANLWYRPLIADGTVITTTAAGTVHALALGDGTERWRYETPGETSVIPSIAPRQGTVLVPIRLEIFDGYVDALTLDGGERAWRLDGIDRPNSISPVIGETFYVGFSDSFRGYSIRDRQPVPADPIPGVSVSSSSNGRMLFADGDLLYLNLPRTNDPVGAYDTAADELVWTYEPFGGAVSFDVWGETLAFGAFDNAVYGLNKATGERRWRVQRDDPFARVAAARGVVWAIQDGGGTLFGIGAETGTVYIEREMPFSLSSIFAVGRSVVAIGGGGIRTYRVETA